METGLRNRVALIAASSQGIGRATARAFGAEGCRLAMCSRDESALRRAANEIQSAHKVEIHAEPVDVADPAALMAFVERVAKKFGGVDVCVTNAGGPPAKGSFLATTVDEWRKAFDLNLLSIAVFAQAVIPHMQKMKWGRFVTITSVAVRQPVPDLVLSNSVRAGVMGLIKSLANEFGKDGINFNNVGPGFTATDRLKNLAAARSKSAGIPEEKIFDSWAQEAALKRLGEPEEIADAIVWLASDRASFVTGQTIVVDGGYYKGL